MPKPVVAIVGRPNVGKSTLFNKLIGARMSIVDDTPGVTRDRIYGDCEWLGNRFLLVDTDGIEPYSDDVILKQMRAQAQVAIDTADVIVLVCDLRCGVVASDQDVAAMLMRSNKPVVLCVNKCDKIGEPEPEFYEFYNLGIGDPIAVSSVHGHGTGDLLDEIIKYFPEQSEDEEEDEEVINVAVIGKPNAGKSSLVNKISGTERAIVSDIAGTTRDATDTYIENEYGKFNFIDTAGLRRKSRVNDDIEKYSIIRARMSVERANVCVIMIDAVEGLEQDSKVAGIALEQGKACIIAVNKWDAVEKDSNTMKEFREKLAVDFSFMSYAPIMFISAKTGQRIDKLFEMIVFVHSQNSMRISTGKLNEVLANATARVQPPSDKGKRLKIFYMTQASTRPPTVVFFVNRADLFHFSYQRYLENQIREIFGLDGTPVRFIVRERGEGKK